MVRTSPELIRKMWRQRARNAGYELSVFRHSFLPEARTQLPERAGRPEFVYFAWRVWRGLEWENPERDWYEELEGDIRTPYLRIESSFDWSLPPGVAASEVDGELLRDTFSVWQPVLPYKLTVARALALIEPVARLGKLEARPC